LGVSLIVTVVVLLSFFLGGRSFFRWYLDESDYSCLDIFSTLLFTIKEKKSKQRGAVVPGMMVPVLPDPEFGNGVKIFIATTEVVSTTSTAKTEYNVHGKRSRVAPSPQHDAELRSRQEIEGEQRENDQLGEAGRSLLEEWDMLSVSSGEEVGTAKGTNVSSSRRDSQDQHEEAIGHVYWSGEDGDSHVEYSDHENGEAQSSSEGEAESSDADSDGDGGGAKGTNMSSSRRDSQDQHEEAIGHVYWSGEDGDSHVEYSDRENGEAQSSSEGEAESSDADSDGDGGGAMQRIFDITSSGSDDGSDSHVEYSDDSDVIHHGEGQAQSSGEGEAESSDSDGGAAMQRIYDITSSDEEDVLKS
jgi:hypothetical protein